MSLGTILLIALILMLVGVLPVCSVATPPLALRPHRNRRRHTGSRTGPVFDGASVIPRGDGGVFH